MPNCLSCAAEVRFANSCDTCKKGPWCSDHSKLCILTNKGKDFDAKYDPVQSLRCEKCVNESSPFQPVIGVCRICGYRLWKIVKCVFCGKGPICNSHSLILTGRGEQVTSCHDCNHSRAKRLKRMNLAASIYADPDINSWLDTNSEWETREREIYMRKAEEKWEYIRAVKARAEVTAVRMQRFSNIRQ